MMKKHWVSAALGADDRKNTLVVKFGTKTKRDQIESISGASAMEKKAIMHKEGRISFNNLLDATQCASRGCSVAQGWLGNAHMLGRIVRCVS